MRKEIIIVLAVFAGVLLYSCGPLEGNEIIGPGGGYVFYDKGHYSDGWRYLESAPESAGKVYLTGTSIDLTEATAMAESFSHGGKSDWRLPTDSEMVHMGNFFLDGNSSKNPSNRKGLTFNNKTFYVTSDGNVFYCHTTITINSTGNEEGSSKFVQGSEPYESDSNFFVHPVRGF